MPQSPPAYRIGQVAALAGLTVDTVRYYERMELLPRPPRTTGGFRRYSSGVLHRLRFIKQAQSFGFTLRDIQQLVGDQHRDSRSACRRIRDLLALRIADIDGRLTELRAFRKTLCEYREACDHALGERREPECPTLDALERTAR